MSDTFEVKRGSVGFTIVTNSVLKDSRLSWQAKGLYSYLVSNTVDWKVFKKEVQNHATNGRESTANAWKELVNLGWITSVAKQEGGKMSGWHHTIHCDLGRERPANDSPIYGKPVRRENRKTGNPQLINNNSNKEQKNKRNVSDETLDECWSELRKLWKISNSPVGNKRDALKLLSKINLTNTATRDKIITEAEKHTKAVKQINLTKPDLNLPNVSTWLSQKRYEQEVTDFYSLVNLPKGQNTPPGSAHPPARNIKKL
jgi:hypothetical protein